MFIKPNLNINKHILIICAAILTGYLSTLLGSNTMLLVSALILFLLVIVLAQKMRFLDKLESTIALAFFLLLLGNLILPGLKFTIPFYTAIQLSIIIILTILVFYKNHFRLKEKKFSLLGIILIFTYTFSAIASKSPHYSLVIPYIIGFFVFQILIYSSKNLIKFVLWTVIIVGLISSIGVYWEFFLPNNFQIIQSNFLNYEIFTGYRITGFAPFPEFATMPITMSVFPSLAVFFNSINIKSKKIYFLICCMLLTSVLIPGSRTYLVAIIAGLIIYLILAFWKNIIKFAFVLTFLVLFAILFASYQPIELTDSKNPFLISVKRVMQIKSGQETSSISTRFDLYNYAWDLFKNSPVLGVGIGEFKNLSGKAGLQGTHTHNMFLQVLSESGLLGLLSTLLLMGWTIIKMFNFALNDNSKIQPMLFAMFLVFFIAILSANAWVVGTLSLYFWVIIGCSLALEKKLEIGG